MAAEDNWPAAASVDSAEIAHFDRLAEDWWDPYGPMRALHRLNPVRVGYLRRLIRQQVRRQGRAAGSPGAPLAGFDILDIGSGGGLLAESLSRLGAHVTAIDPAPGNIEVARRHAEAAGLSIDYLCTSAEALAAEARSFDVVLAMEVVEHVRDVAAFVAVAASMVRPHGLFVAATLNRTLKSYALAILGAEYVLHWVPKGTHRWAQFVKPRELAAALRAAGLHVIDDLGVVFEPLSGDWQESRNTDVNYMMAAERRG